MDINMKYGNDKDFESPFDTFFFHPLATKTVDIYKQLGLTPNNVTTLSLICSLLSTYYLYYGKYNTAAFIYLLNYYFDCVDGRLARKYKMSSDIGEAYDTLSDNIAGAILLLVMFYLIKNEYKLYFIIIAVILIILVNYWYVKNEIYIKGDNFYQNVLIRLKDIPINRLYDKFVKQAHTNYIYTKDYIPEIIKNNYKYFGPGTTNIIIAIVLANFNLLKINS